MTVGSTPNDLLRVISTMDDPFTDPLPDPFWDLLGAPTPAFPE
jgi:hypothetical protein